MRIVGGELKGRRIRTAVAARLRPSTERVREAIFSVLGDDLPGAAVADLFCGSGALGLEALSRGAARALFVESSAPTVKVVMRNVRDLGLESRAELYQRSVFRLSPNILADIDIIFADPPYGGNYSDRLIELLCLKKTAFDGILALEHEREWSYRRLYPAVLRRLEFGDSAVSFFDFRQRQWDDDLED